jgi:hypothetical protein
MATVLMLDHYQDAEADPEAGKADANEQLRFEGSRLPHQLNGSARVQSL